MYFRRKQKTLEAAPPAHFSTFGDTGGGSGWIWGGFETMVPKIKTSTILGSVQEYLSGALKDLFFGVICCFFVFFGPGRIYLIIRDRNRNFQTDTDILVPLLPKNNTMNTRKYQPPCTGFARTRRWIFVCVHCISFGKMDTKMSVSVWNFRFQSRIIK